MLGIYLVATLLSQIYSHGASMLSSSALQHVQSSVQQLHVHFDRLNGIKVGALVYADGEVVGNVARISALDDRHGLERAKDPGDHLPAGFDVDVQIVASRSELIRPNLVALIACPLSSGRNNVDAAVELIPTGEEAFKTDVPAQNNVRALRLNGFSSYEQYWSNSTAVSL